MIHPTIGWRQDEQGTHKHAHGSWIPWSLTRVRSKTMHSLACITSWLPYITLRYIFSRFFLPLEQSRAALSGCRFAARRLREAARWQFFWYKVFVHWKLKLFNFLVHSVLIRTGSRLQRHSVSLAWRLDREMRRRLILQETKQIYSLNVVYFLLYRHRYFLLLSELI